jgi:phage terminase small subunit|tara:strand:- start:3409 stop:3810 length:402 start_codon:yes stop_codon:yes gene_type:complete
MVNKSIATSESDDLTDKQRKLVDTIVTTGCSITEAGIIAGYSTKKNKESARVSASRTLRIPKVQSYMMKQIANTVGLGAVHASRKMVDLSMNARSEYVQLEASKDILDRVGIRAPDKVHHTLDANLSVNIDLT